MKSRKVKYILIIGIQLFCMNIKTFFFLIQITKQLMTLNLMKIKKHKFVRTSVRKTCISIQNHFLNHSL